MPTWLIVLFAASFVASVMIVIFQLHLNRRAKALREELRRHDETFRDLILRQTRN